MSEIFSAIASLCCGVFGIGALLAGGAVILRTAVSFSNRLIGVSAKSDGYHEFDGSPDPWIGYRRFKQPVKGIREPGIGKGMMMTLVLCFVDILSGIPVRIISNVDIFDDRDHRWGTIFTCHFAGVVLFFPLGAWIVSSLLPSSFGRACLVLLATYVILIALVGGLYMLLNTLLG